MPPSRLPFVVVFLALMPFLAAAPARAGDKGKFDPSRWDKALAALDRQDEKNPPPRGAVLFIGSSTIRGWNLAKHFPELATVNRGFGGSHVADAAHFAERLVVRHAPRVVVFYAGDNDIAAGKNPEQVLRDFEAFVKAVRAALPHVRILFLSIKPSPSRLKFLEAQRQANDLIAAYCRKGANLAYLDMGTPMLGDDGAPRAELFVKDKLHLSEEGYRLWSALLRPHLSGPRPVAHRGLLRHAPENTLAAFSSCIDLRLGFELDVRRTRDGHLVCLHDEDVRRTTDGKGKVADLTLAELRKLDAGAWFDPRFAGERVPTLEEVFALLRDRKAKDMLVALDLKIDDAALPDELAKLARKYGVTEQVVCIGLAIERAGLRRRLREADAKLPVAVLAQTAADLPAALKDGGADWAYVRFVPTAEQVGQARRAGKRVLLVGPSVMGREPENWRRGGEAGVDAVLTDYPLDCREVWRAAVRQ